MKELSHWKKGILLGGVILISLFLITGNLSAQTQMQMSLGGVTGTYYMIGAPLAKYVNQHSKTLNVTPNTSGGSVENIRRVDSGSAPLGMTQTDVMYPAWHGLKPFEKPLRNWRVIGITTPVMANHVVTLASYNIKTISDLKGKIFAIGAPGSAAASAMDLFLDHTGLKKEIDARMLPHQDYPEMLLDGKIHALNRSGAVPATVVEEISSQKKIALVDFGAELEKSGFLQKYPYYQKAFVKGSTYKDEPRDITFFGNAGFFIVHKDVPDDHVYELTRLCYSEEAVSFVAMAFKGQNLNRKDPFEGNIGPVHPGAARYWKEQGIQVPEAVLK